MLVGAPGDGTEELLEKPVDATEEENGAGLDTNTAPDVEAVLLVASDDVGLLKDVAEEPVAVSPELVAGNDAPELLATGMEEGDDNAPPEDTTTDDCVFDPETPEEVGGATRLVVVPAEAVMDCALEDSMELELLGGRPVGLM